MTTLNKESDRLRIEELNGSRIVFVDYAGLKERQMIELCLKHLELTLQTKLTFIADFKNCYATGEYMKHGRKFVELTKEFINKAAFLGIDEIKSYILKGVCLEYGVNYKAFGSKEKAVQFLTKA